MDITRWKYILNEWVKKTELVDIHGTLEQNNIDLFYEKFRSKIHQTDPSLEPDLPSFLSARYERYEILFDETNNISSQDYVYIFSLLLFYSCVTRVNKFFQQCCESLDSKLQPNVANFFASLKQKIEQKEPLTKETLRSAVKQAIPSPVSIRFISSSPLKTPERVPTTPNKIAIQERLQELQKMKTMLENERYERNMLDAEVKQFEERIDVLVKEKRALKQDLQKLQTEQMMSKDTENFSPNKAIRDEQIRLKMQKEINSREEMIVSLRCEVDILTSKNQKSSNRIAFMEKEMNNLRSKLNELGSIIDELHECVTEKNMKIQHLEATNEELNYHIEQTRIANQRDSSSDCLDNSISYTTAITWSSNDSGENLARSVIDIQLKEKESEIQQLQEELAVVNEEKESLEVTLKEHKSTIESLENNLKETSLNCSVHNDTINKLQTQLSEKSTENEMISGDLAKLKTTIESVSKENEALKSGIQQSQEEIEKMKRTVKENIQALKDQLKAAEAGRQEFQKMLEDEKINFTKLRKEFQDETASSSQQLASLQTLNIQNSTQIQELNDQLKVANGKEAELNTLLEAEKNKLQKLSEQRDIESESFKQQIESLRADFELSRKENESLQAEKGEIQDKMDFLEAEMRTLEADKQELQESLESIKRTMLKSHESDVTLLNQQLESLRNENVEKSSQLRALSFQFQEAQEARSELEKSLEAKNQEISEQAKEIQRKMESFEAEKQDLKTELQQSIEKHASLKLELDSLRSESFEKSSQALALRNKLKETEEARSVVEKLFEEEKQKAVQQIVEIEQKLNAENQELKQSLEHTKASFSSLVQNHESEVLSFNQQLESLRTESDEKTSRLQVLNSKLETGLKEAEDARCGLEKLLQEEVFSYNLRIESLRADLELSIKNNQNLEAANQKAIEDKVQIEQKIEALEAQARSLEAEKLEIQQSLEDRESEVISLNERLELISSESDGVSSQIQPLNDQLKQSEEACRQLEKLLEAEKHEAEQQLEDFKVRLNSFEVLSETLKAEKQELLQVLEETKASITSLTKDHESKVTSLKQQLEALHTETSEKTSQLKVLNGQFKEVQDSHNELEKLLEAESRKATEQREEIQQKLEAQSRTLEAEKEGLQKLLDETKISISNLLKDHESEVESLNQQINSILSESAEKSSQIEMLNDQLKKAQDSHSSELISLTEQVKDVEERVEETKLQLEEKQSKLRESDEARNVLEEKLRSETQAFEQQTLELKLTIEDLKISIAKKESNFEDQIANLNHQLDQELENKKTAVEDVKLQLVDKEAELLDLVTQIDELKVVYREQVNGLEQKLQSVQQQFETSNQELEEAKKLKSSLEQQILLIKESKSNDNSRVEELLKKLENYSDLEEKLQALEVEHQKERLFNDKLNKDNSIYNAKLLLVRQEKDEMQKSFIAERESLQAQIAEIKRKAKEDVEEVRFEYDGKLEKMKEKMSSLYTDGISKRDQKHAEKLTELRDELKRQGEKLMQYEEHIEKLTKQLMALNEMKIQNSQLTKENNHMRSKIQFMESSAGRPSIGSFGLGRMPSTMTQMNGANLGMEDEAGEEFNNTYLSELKNGESQSSLNKTVVLIASEMQKRNSMYPQHMRDSYAIGGFDRELNELEMKNGGNGFDDSQTALLNQNMHNRKKQSTSYKRPGPPTPSKIAGANRLSIGSGSEVGYHNILSDCTNKEFKNTPSRLFNYFKKDAEKKKSPGRLSLFGRKK